MPEANLFLMFTQRLNTLGVRYMVSGSVAVVRKLEYYREGGLEKHLRDIRSMLNTSPGAIQTAELEQQIAARGLQEAWRQVQERRD